MNRTYLKDLKAAVGTEVSVSGWVDMRRDHGKLIFLDIRDMSGKVQAVVLPNHAEAQEAAKQLRSEWVVRIHAKVNARPPKMISKDKVTGETLPNGDIELEVLGVEILAKAHELPFELTAEVNLDTYLDYLPFTLRSERARKIFKVQETIIQSFR